MSSPADEGVPTREEDNLAEVLEVIGYEQAKILHTAPPSDVFELLEILNAEARGQPDHVAPLPELYPAIVRLAALSLMALRCLPLPQEIDDLQGFEGVLD